MLMASSHFINVQTVWHMLKKLLYQSYFYKLIVHRMCSGSQNFSRKSTVVSPKCCQLAFYAAKMLIASSHFIFVQTGPHMLKEHLHQSYFYKLIVHRMCSGSRNFSRWSTVVRPKCCQLSF